ncbi:MAG: hypothetical protein R3C05_16690 [Pirellulaceae bacterium]
MNHTGRASEGNQSSQAFHRYGDWTDRRCQPANDRADPRRSVAIKKLNAAFNESAIEDDPSRSLDVTFDEDREYMSAWGGIPEFGIYRRNWQRTIFG